MQAKINARTFNVSVRRSGSLRPIESHNFRTEAEAYAFAESQLVKHRGQGFRVAVAEVVQEVPAKETPTAGHTPGPWFPVESKHGNALVINDNPKLPTIAILNASDARENALYDARLIASAPELLAALKALLSPYNLSDEYQVKIDAGLAAIAKAEGK